MEKHGNNRSDLIEYILEDVTLEDADDSKYSKEEHSKLVKPISQFLCFTADSILGSLQNMLVSGDSIKQTTIEDGVERIHYSVKYSPAIIFSNLVPAFDVNYIDTSKAKTKLKTQDTTILLGISSDKDECVEASIVTLMRELDYNISSDETDSFSDILLTVRKYLNDEENWNINKCSDDIKIENDIYNLYYNPSAYTSRGSWHFEKINSEDELNPEGWVSNEYCEYDGDICNQDNIYESIKAYIQLTYGQVSDAYKEDSQAIKIKLQQVVDTLEYGESEQITIQNGNNDVIVHVERGGTQVNDSDKYHIYLKSQVIGEYLSTTKVLQSTIATFYSVLRKIALIGLLSVLVYMGIKMVLTSTSAKDKAKYKAMLKDWLVALCILFTLHFIMSITVTVVEGISDIFQISMINEEDEDVMLTTIRNKIASAKTWSQVFVEVLLYSMVAVYTVIFTIQYLRRTIYIAFLTVISPLITLTYPLDKIKDNKSQAFDMWIKDYIFFMLLQVVHLLIYYIIVNASFEMESPENWIIAIATMAFLVPAEKIIKKMFGFDKNSKTLSALAVGATGGLVLNALNVIGGKSGAKKDGSKEKSNESNSNKVRTASNTSLNDALSSLKGAGDLVPPKTQQGVGKTVLKGTMGVGKKYFRKSTETLMGEGLGVAGGIIGFAAGGLTGDISSALAGAATGRKAGKSTGSNVVNFGANILNSPKTIREAINNLQDTYNEGTYGTAYVENAKEMREFKASSEYEALKDKYGENFTDEKLSIMLQAGINEKNDMDKVLQSDNISDAIGYYTLAKKCPDSIYYDNDKLQKYLEDLNINETDAKIMRDNMRKFR